MSDSLSTEDRSLKRCWGCGAEFYFYGRGTYVYPGLWRHWSKHWRKCLRRGVEKLRGALRG